MMFHFLLNCVMLRNKRESIIIIIIIYINMRIDIYEQIS